MLGRVGAIAERNLWNRRGERPCSERSTLHLLQNRATEQTIGVGKLLRNLKVIVPLHDGECDGLARRLDSGGEIAALPLELRRFGSAINQGDRRHQLPLPATPPLIIVGGMPKSFC